MIVKEFFALLGIKVDDAAFQKADGALNNVRVGLVALAGAAAVGIGAIVRTTASYEGLKSALVTATKSVSGAEAAFLDLQTFADATPYSLEQATKAYIRMSSAGLTPTIEALTDFGDIASAIPGKSILDFVEAVADGTQGQGRRLKEFGIDLNKQGSNVELVFGKMHKVVKNNAEDIQQAIRDISKENFGGSMERASQTLDGMFSTLKDKAAGLAFDLGEGGLLPALKQVVGGFTRVLVAIKPVARAFGSALNVAIKTVYRALAPFGVALAWVGKKLSDLLGYLGNAPLLFAVNTLAGAFVLLGINAVRAATATLLGWLAAAAPLIGMAALVGALLLLLEDVWVWFNGGESVLGDLLGTWDEFWKKITTVNPDDPWWLKAIKESLKAAGELIDMLKKLDPKRFAEDTIQEVKGGITSFTGAIGDINKGLEKKAKDNRLKSGKFTQKDILDAAKATEDQAMYDEQAKWAVGALKGILPSVNAMTQGAVAGSSVAGANAITNNSQKSKSTTTVHAPITIENKNDKSTAETVADYLLGPLLDVKGAPP